MSFRLFGGRDHAGMPHDHKTSGHAHAASGGRAIGIAALITGTFMFVEFAGGLLSGSLALLADAGHMLNDFVSLVLAWFGARLAMKPADSARTYGYGRFSVLAAFVNGLSLFLVAGWICFEAYDRFSEPVEILGGMMLWVAIGGLIANLLSFWVLSRQGSDNLNIRAAILHVAGDLLGSLGALTTPPSSDAVMPSALERGYSPWPVLPGHPGQAELNDSVRHSKLLTQQIFHVILDLAPVETGLVHHLECHHRAFLGNGPGVNVFNLHDARHRADNLAGRFPALKSDGCPLQQNMPALFHNLPCGSQNDHRDKHRQ